MDKEREAFEEWFLTQYFSKCQYYNGRVNCYDTETADAFAHAWEGWQARAKQTITLPVKDATGEH